MSIAGAILLLFLFAAPGLFCGVYQKNAIPFRDMTKDGIAITPSSHFGKISTRDFYSVTVQFGDITYQLADDETQQSIFEDYRDVLNYFDDTVDFQLTFEVRRQNARKIMSDMTPEPLLNAIEELTVLNREITAKEEQLFNICMTICVYAKSQKKLDLKIDALRRVCQNALAEKSDFITSLLELIVGGQFGLTASERSIIDRAVRAVYIPFLENNPTLETMPMLSDLHNELIEYGEAAALCRERADWAVGINATRLFSVLYDTAKPLNVGRVQSPTLALIAARQPPVGSAWRLRSQEKN